MCGNITGSDLQGGTRRCRQCLTCQARYANTTAIVEMKVVAARFLHSIGSDTKDRRSVGLSLAIAIGWKACPWGDGLLKDELSSSQLHVLKMPEWQSLT